MTAESPTSSSARAACALDSTDQTSRLYIILQEMQRTVISHGIHTKQAWRRHLTPCMNEWGLSSIRRQMYRWYAAPNLQLTANCLKWLPRMSGFMVAGGSTDGPVLKNVYGRDKKSQHEKTKQVIYWHSFRSGWIKSEFSPHNRNRFKSEKCSKTSSAAS